MSPNGSDPKDNLLSQHREAAASPMEKAATLIDHLVDAMAGEPSAPLRRVLTLIDIAQNPGTSQTAILARLPILDKSNLTRDIDWLYNYGCITRNVSESSARESALTICGFSRNHLGFAAYLLNNRLESLQKFLEGYINFFQGYRATLRDAKIVTVLTANGETPRQEIFDELYNGPMSTDNRALLALIEEGFVTNDGTGIE